MAHVEKKCVNVTTFWIIYGETKNNWMKDVGNLVAKTVLVKSANQFSLKVGHNTAWNIFFEAISTIRPMAKP